MPSSSTASSFCSWGHATSCSHAVVMSCASAYLQQVYRAYGSMHAAHAAAVVVGWARLGLGVQRVQPCVELLEVKEALEPLAQPRDRADL